MSSNIKIQRICIFCGKEFIARQTSTRYCSHKCNSAAYKAGLKEQKINESNKEVLAIRNQPFTELKTKEFLTVKDAAILMTSSTKSIYRMIKQGKLKAINIGFRKTRIRRSEIDRLFND